MSLVAKSSWVVEEPAGVHISAAAVVSRLERSKLSAMKGPGLALASPKMVMETFCGAVLNLHRTPASASIRFSYSTEDRKEIAKPTENVSTMRSVLSKPSTLIHLHRHTEIGY